MKLRVLLGFVSYGPYHLARLNACRAALPEWEVLGWELSSEQSEYGWLHSGGEGIVESVTSEPLESLRARQWLARVWRHLDQLQPAVCVLAGYAHPGMLAAMLWCRLKGRGVVIMSDSKEDDAPRRPWVEWLKGRLLACYDAALVAGGAHRDYFVKMGFRPERIRCGYDVVDNEAYGQPQPRPPLRKPYFLTVSRFIPKKNLPIILDSYAQYVGHVGKEQAWDMVICGDGPLRSDLQDQIQKLALGEHVHLPGFLQMEALLPYLAHAHTLVHASIQEQWGLVVNEAMAAGLPVLVSNVCGCFPDLVREGENGFGFDPHDVEGLAALLIRFHSLPEIQRKALGENGRRWIHTSHSPEHFARSLEACVGLALASHPLAGRDLK